MTMSVEIKTLMDKLGVGYVPGPYESCPWSHYDPAAGLTCSAEMRMGGDSNELEGEIQMMYDSPPPGKLPMEQTCYIRCAPASGDQWTVTAFRVRGAPYGADAYNWEEKACLFFQLVVQELGGGRMPDIDALLDDAFYSRERYADQQGGGGGQSPKIKTNDLLNTMKGGRGF